MNSPLFDEELAPVPATLRREEPLQDKAVPRYRSPNREQIELRPCSLEEWVAEDHTVRTVWAFVMGLELSSLYEAMGLVEGRAGRPRIDPAILMGL
jgi:hypothetical protein